MNALKTVLLAGLISMPVATAAYAADPIEPIPSDPVPVTSEDIGIYLRGDLGWSFLEWSGGDDDNGLMLGGGIGYQASDYLRTDLTVDWAGDYNVGPGPDISTLTVMGNAYFDWANDTAFTPYVGAGVGYGWVENNPNGVAVGVAAGVAVDLSDNLALDVGYRFRDIMASGPDVKEHQLTAGMRFSF